MKTKQKQKWVELGSRFNVAGVQYNDYQRVKGGLKVGNQVRFIGEPRNLYDKRAIRIEYNGIKIGYVPSGSDLQHAMWAEHNSKSVLVGVVTAFNKTNPTWNMITIQALALRKGVTKNEGEVHFSKMKAELSYQ